MRRAGLIVPLLLWAAPVMGAAQDAAAPGQVAQPAATVQTPAAVDATHEAEAAPDAHAASAPHPASRNGISIHDAFRQGLADPVCEGEQQERWMRHFAHAPSRLADPGSDALPLFGYVVDALREAHLPTEFALIPFIESGYAPAARSRAGPAGLWQLAAVTARHHGLHVSEGDDARLSPAESTRAAVRYLKTLNGMFGGNWRLAAMAYNAGEHRLLQALKRSGASAREAAPDDLPGMPPLTRAYVDKLHALACVLARAGEGERWRQALDRPVPHLRAQRLAAGERLDAWARRHAHDPALLARLNPALADGRRGRAALALVPASPSASPETAAQDAPATGQDRDGPAHAAAASVAQARSAGKHTVRSGESAWSIARRHGLKLDRLLELNGLGRRSVLRPGMVLRIE